MNPNDVALLESLLLGLAQTLSSALRDTNLALEVLAARKRRDGAPTSGPRFALRELVDDARFAVRWRGRECHLGQSVPFRLFRRLALSANHYVPNEQLLEDVWGGARSPSAVRTAVLSLRRKLAESGMEDLAGAIDGANAGHYGLRLDRLTGTRRSDREPTQTRR